MGQKSKGETGSPRLIWPLPKGTFVEISSLKKKEVVARYQDLGRYICRCVDKYTYIDRFRCSCDKLGRCLSFQELAMLQPESEQRGQRSQWAA
jgi:hypothetical protein